MATAAIGGILAGVGAWGAGATAIGIAVAAGAAFAAGALQERAVAKREKAQQRAVEEQKKQAAINNAQQALARQRSIKQSIAQARVIRAQIEAQSFTSGGPAGAGQAITGDTGSAIGAGLIREGAARGISASQGRQLQFQNDARSANNYDTYAAFASALGTGVNLYNKGAFEGIGDLFSFGNNAPSAPAITFTDIGGGAAAGGR